MTKECTLPSNNHRSNRSALRVDGFTNLQLNSPCRVHTNCRATLSSLQSSSLSLACMIGETEAFGVREKRGRTYHHSLTTGSQIDQPPSADRCRCCVWIARMKGWCVAAGLSQLKSYSRPRTILTWRTSHKTTRYSRRKMERKHELPSASRSSYCISMS